MDRDEHPAVAPCAITGQGFTNESLKRRLLAERETVRKERRYVAEMWHAIERARMHIAFERYDLAEDTLSAAVGEPTDMPPPVTDDMVERAARAMNLAAGRQRGLAFEDDWDAITEQERGGWRQCARAGLVAASSRKQKT